MAKTKKNTVRLDLSAIDSRLNLHGFSGQYAFQITSAIFGKSSQSGQDQIQLKTTIIDSPYPKFVDKSLNVVLNLQPQSLWVLRQLLEAVEVEIPSGAFELDLDELISRRFSATVEDNSYDGKNNHRITGYTFYDDSEEQPTVVKKKATKVEDDEDEGEAPKAAKKSTKVEEEEAPAAKKTSKAKVEYTSDDIMDMDADELETLVEKLGLDVTLSEYTTLRKKINVVIEALITAGFMEEDA
jgi:hypothetical protein